MIISSVSQGLIWGVLGLGIYLTFRILNFPDMTTEGSFPLGGAVAVTAISLGWNPFLSTLLGMLSGALAGFFNRAVIYERKNANTFSWNFGDDVM